VPQQDLVSDGLADLFEPGLLAFTLDQNRVPHKQLGANQTLIKLEQQHEVSTVACAEAYRQVKHLLNIQCVAVVGHTMRRANVVLDEGHHGVGVLQWMDTTAGEKQGQ
jgi:hypothetical protein